MTPPLGCCNHPSLAWLYLDVQPLRIEFKLNILRARGKIFIDSSMVVPCEHTTPLDNLITTSTTTALEQNCHRPAFVMKLKQHDDTRLTMAIEQMLSLWTKRSWQRVRQLTACKTSEQNDRWNRFGKWYVKIWNEYIFNRRWLQISKYHSQCFVGTAM